MTDSRNAADRTFPNGFLWGAATAAHQIEGSPMADGAGPSIWTRFAHTPGMTLNGDTGDVACDHYRRWKEDVKLMKELGLQAYRFSVSWSRILPEGTGRVNQAGLDFYSRLVDELLANGIEPLLTLYHWDMPAALDDRGGWLNRDCADWFAEYGQVMYRALDGRVKKWVTLNEPWVITDGGYLHGALAPGHRSRFEAPIASHNLMRAHGAAVQAYRAEGKHEIGLVVNIEPKYAATDSAEDAAAVKRAHAYMNEQYLDPALLGTYPPELREIFGEAWPEWPQADFDLIKQKLDFIGVNYYTRSVTKDAVSYPLNTGVVRQPSGTYTETGWEVFPQGLTDTLTWVKDRYGDIPMYITENGAAFFDPPVAEPDSTGQRRVRDPLRMDYLQKHIGAIHDAIQAGCDIRGYMVWSLLDNLEWSLGYSKRFGVVHVNYATQDRTPKDSARWYSKVIASNGKFLEEPLP
ncbi:beta-galactosidase [Lysobacter capsici]|jgi:beta-glucosidase|uniref:Beta-glucosidase n=1 Tax=Lysobacter capsici AZ78 TaxID=1444315 RepID=A0A108U516_9GAMM|nr:GH1 family beta-glucosidase [Lysobacter capsici]ALN86198.1 beta-galactosidase [Lysobacter capsici]ATE72217.1 beta-glucosidase [Lysobacter capsici]KWS02682.1 Beta-glucosidase [Lysobacter capsici AZ78]